MKYLKPYWHWEPMPPNEQRPSNGMEACGDACSCPHGGYCARHAVAKSDYAVKLCQERTGYFRKYEQGIGLGQLARNGKLIRTPPTPRELPPLRNQAVNFLKALARFAGDSFQCVGQEEFDRRVGICMDCELFIRRSGRCSKCGCCGKLKALGRIWKCPVGKW